MARELLAKGVKLTGADIAEHDADGAEGQLGQAALCVPVTGGTRVRELRCCGGVGHFQAGEERPLIPCSTSPARPEAAALSMAPIRTAMATKRFGRTIDPDRKSTRLNSSH